MTFQAKFYTLIEKFTDALQIFTIECYTCSFTTYLGLTIERVTKENLTSNSFQHCTLEKKLNR